MRSEILRDDQCVVGCTSDVVLLHSMQDRGDQNGLLAFEQTVQNTLPLVHDSNMYFHKKAAALKARFFCFSFLCRELRIWKGADLNNDIFWKIAAPEYSPANTFTRYTEDARVISAYLYNQTRINTCTWLFVLFFLSFIAHKVRTYVWSERIGKLFLVPISRILPREGSKGRDKSAVRIFSVRQWKNMISGKKHCKGWGGFHRSMCLGRLCMYFGYWDCRSVSE